MINYENTSCSIFLKLLPFLLILYSADLVASCASHCGGVEIPYPFGIGKGCYLEKSYEIQCRNTTSGRQQVPFLSAIGKEVVEIYLPIVENSVTYESSKGIHSLTFGLVRVKTPITSAGCLAGGEESIESIMNFTGTPFFIDDSNTLIGVGCNAKVSLTHIKPNMVGCELTCNTTEDHQPSSNNNNIPFLDKTGCSNKTLSYRYQEECTGNRPEETDCNGNGCCEVNLLKDPQQAIGIRIDGNSTTRQEHCRVAFITDEVYTLSNATKPRELFSKEYATFSLSWVIQTKNHSFLSSLRCNNTTVYGQTSYSVGPQMNCICDQSTISEITYAHCGCIRGFKGNAYVPDGCQDINECEDIPCGERNMCVNTQGGYHCVGDKKNQYS
ncbi:unnamed protein product [Eruca vesicaria subsp. sativa]|uniref:Uncharacterized protein n=1 Tax=Eruca vesicaria subsp. sativa TaxID=29727 RepID=A0ABC8KIT7_ERUVS|nr:unnamed protein product [Eruca vesicaria subsp. sativa]